MKGISQRWLWAILVIALGAVLSVLFVPTRQGVPVYAPQGKVIAGFPQDLLLDTTAVITKSYAIKVSSSTSQYTVTWQSATSSEALLGSYRAYFGAKNWETISQQTSFSVDGLYVSDGNNTANLTIAPDLTGQLVTLSYVTGMQVKPSLAQPFLSVHQGTLVADFPPEFILGVSSTILSSSENPDSVAGLHTVAAVYRSGASLQSLYSSYISFLENQGFQIITQSTSSVPLAIGANNSSLGKSVSVSLQTVGGASVAIVSIQTKMTIP